MRRAKKYICEVLCDLVQFEKHEKHPWRSVTFSIVAGFYPPWVFFTFFKLQKWYQIAQSIKFLLQRLQFPILPSRQHVKDYKTAFTQPNQGAVNKLFSKFL